MSLDKALCIVLAAAFMAGLYFTPSQTDYNPPHTWPQLASAFVVAVCIMVLGFRALERKERERDQLYAELGGAGPDFGPYPYAHRRRPRGRNLIHAAVLSSAVPDVTRSSMSPSHHDATSSVRTPCCDRMRADLAHVCNVHQDRFDCPDALVAEIRGGYGLMIHDGGHSVIEIAFCPWCGEKLPAIGEPPPPTVEEDADDPDGIETAGRDSGC